MGYTWGSGVASVRRRSAPRSRNAPFTPQWPACLDRKRSIIEQVSEHEVLLSYPYQSMDPFVQLLREAASDPAVISIKITLYRLASQSHLAEALIDAAENGKEVTALFELRARFDESNNIEWSQRFEAGGLQRHLRLPRLQGALEDLLHHAPDRKRPAAHHAAGHRQLQREDGEALHRLLVHHHAMPTIGRDAAEFFRNMALENTSDNYDILWVAPLQIKPMHPGATSTCRSSARGRGEPCGLFFKTNSITDKEVIDKLVEASQAGVPIDAVRARHLLHRAGRGRATPENVRVVSIVGRLLGAQPHLRLRPARRHASCTCRAPTS